MKTKPHTDLLFKIEDFQNTIADVKNIDLLYDELLFKDFNFLNPEQPWSTERFQKRFVVIHSMINIIIHQLNNILKDMDCCIKDGLNIQEDRQE